MFSKYDPQTRSISITWISVRNATSLGPPPTYYTRNSADGAQQFVLTNLLPDSDAHKSFRMFSSSLGKRTDIKNRDRLKKKERKIGMSLTSRRTFLSIMVTLYQYIKGSFSMFKRNQAFFIESDSLESQTRPLCALYLVVCADKQVHF